MSNMSVNVAGVEWKNPVTVASGTFGSGAEYSEFVDLNRLGAVTTKGVANKPWEGNPTPRVAEVYGGMLNAVGLQNPGIELFCKRDIPFLKQFDTRIVVNVCGHSLDEYLDVVKRLADEPIDMMEINISCPNVKEGGIAFGTDPKGVETITSEIKKYAKQPVIMKLSPNVTSIAEIARAAEAGGADAVSLINTITGMKIDINRRSFVLANQDGRHERSGGSSGCSAHGLRDSTCSQYSDYRNGRYHKCCRCYRDDTCRSYGCFSRHSKLCKSKDHRADSGWHRRVYGQVWSKGYFRACRRG